MNYFDFRYITFAYPLYFLLLLVIPFYIYWQIKKNQKATFTISSLKGLQQVSLSFKQKLLPLQHFFRVLTFLFFTIALARPQSSKINEVVNSEGIDIVLSLDISGSMLAQDFEPNRLEAAKKVAKEFIEKRPTDRIGLVIFSGESFTQTPITSDQHILLEQLNNIRSGLLKDGTAIGMGLATAVDRLRNSKANSKIIILLTDGVNTESIIGPETALEIAKAYKIRVYTIGVGSVGMAPYPTQDPFGNIIMQQMPVNIDEPLLQKMAKETGGQYYRAKNNNALRAIYSEIDKLEKTKVEINAYKQYAELFFPYAFIGLVFLLLEIILRYTWFKKLV